MDGAIDSKEFFEVLYMYVGMGVYIYIDTADSRRHDPPFSESWKLEVGSWKQV